MNSLIVRLNILITGVFAVLTLIAAWLFTPGLRGMIVAVDLALFAIGSVCIAAAPDFDMLLLGRAIQGIGAGGIAPVASAVACASGKLSGLTKYRCCKPMVFMARAEEPILPP